MVLKSDQFKNVVAQNIHINERHPDSVVEQGIQFSATSGFMMAPSKDVAARTDITGFVLTAYDNQGKTVWAESSGGGGSGSPAGSVQGAIQLRNAAGDDFEANDSLRWISGTTTLSIPGTVTATTVSGLTAPTASTDAANKAYVDSIAGSGVSWKNPVVRASTSTDGSGANGQIALIGQSDNISIDGGVNLSDASFVSGQRFLLKHQTDPKENAIYELVKPGTGGAGFVNFTLASDVDGAKASGTAVFVEDGATQADQGYVVTDVVGTDEFGNIGLTSVTWGQFTSNNVTVGGTLLGEIQYNDGSGGFAAATDFIFTSASQLLTVGNAADNGSIKLGTDRLDLSHNGTNGTLTNNLGTLTIDNDTRDVIISDVVLNEGSVTASTVLFQEDSGTELITLKAPTGVAGNFDIILPNVAGGDKQMLYSNASQELSWNYPNQNYVIKNIVAGDNTGGGSGEYSTGTPYNVQPGDRFIYVEESTFNSGASNVAINLPAANSIPGMIITIGDKGGLQSNTTLGIIEIHVAGASGNLIQGYGIGSVSSFNLTGAADYTGVSLISDGDNLWHLIA